MKSKVKHVCGAVLLGQWVKHLCVNPDLDVHPFSVTNLTEQYYHQSYSEGQKMATN